MQNSNFRPSILMGSKNPMKVNDSSLKNSQNPNNSITKSKKVLKNLNKLNSDRLFILSPTVYEEKDIECSTNDFSQERDHILLGYIGKAIKAMHKQSKIYYSIKAIRKDKIKKSGLINTLNKYIDIMYKVENCFFLRLLNHFEDDSNLCLIFQYINEVTLLKKIKLNELTKEKIYKYLKQILEALQYLHSKDIFFVSLEPESIIIDDNDNVRLTDYAYSKISGSESNTREGYKTDNNVFINCYTAPELISYNKGKLHKHRSKGSEKSDLWQIGMLAYEMITGNLLFSKTTGEDEFFKLISTPFIKNNEIIKKISQIPDEYKNFTDIIMQLLYFNPNERISIEQILNLKEIQNINYVKEQFDPSERIINLKTETEEGTPQEQLINKLKKENKILKNEISELKSIINELTTKNEDLNKQNIDLKKIINEEPNEDKIKKGIELKSQIRKLEFDNKLTECSLKQEKETNEALNNKIRELEMGFNENNYKSSETIKSLEKKIEDLENKLFHPTNNGYSNESLQYYLSLFNENINQFTSFINHQSKINNDISESHLNKIENFINKKEKVFNDMVNDIILKMSQNIILRNSGNFDNNNNNNNKNNNNLNEKNYKDKIVWLEKQTEELIPFKQKCLLLNEQVNKLQSENEILKNKIDNLKKLSKEKEELNNLKLQNIKKKIKEDFDKFIMQNCPNKYDEFKLIYQNINFN